MRKRFSYRYSGSRGARYFVVFLSADDQVKSHYKSFLGDAHIDFMDCSCKLSPDMKVGGEGHPSGEMNSLWAACISDSPGQ